MSFKCEILRVFIASPSDLTEERQAATEAVSDWNAQHAIAESVVLLPVKWETHAAPQTGVRPQEAINKQLVHAGRTLPKWNCCLPVNWIIKRQSNSGNPPRL
jgi:hypothetical protein